MDPLYDRFRAFGWQVEIIDGHDHAALLPALGAPIGSREKPVCVIANSPKGKLVSLMEGKAASHHGVPNAAQFAQAMEELV